MSELWVQERVVKGEIQMIKVRGEDNLADVLTKHVSNDILTKMISRMNCWCFQDRHELAPQCEISSGVAVDDQMGFESDALEGEQDDNVQQVFCDDSKHNEFANHSRNWFNKPAE